MSKAASALLGYNNNVRHKNRVFHIQTEDSGVKYGHIITHLFMDGGRILKSVKTSYSEYLGNEKMSDIVREMMKQQHKAMFIALRDGKFDHLVEGAADVSQQTKALVVEAAAAKLAEARAGSDGTEKARSPAPGPVVAGGPGPGAGAAAVAAMAAGAAAAAASTADAAAAALAAAARDRPPDPKISSPQLVAVAPPPAPPVPPPSAAHPIAPMPRAPTPLVLKQPAKRPSLAPGSAVANGRRPSVKPAPSDDDGGPQTERTLPEELTLDIEALERAAAAADAASPTFKPSSDLPPPPTNLFREKTATGSYRSVSQPPAPGSVPPPAAPPKAPALPQVARPGAAAERRYAPTRPASIFGQARPQQGKTIFGEDLISDKSLDEVILSYLADDLDPPAEKK